MKRIRGFKIKHRVTRLFRHLCHRNWSASRYRRLDPPTWKAKPISRLFSCIKTKAKSFCFANRVGISGKSYMPLEDGRLLEDKGTAVPKGHMAVYVGQKDGDFHRFLVPVIYFNHPLFGDLLREAEEEFGFNHPGGITIPCRISEFERVQTRIAGCRNLKKALRL